MGWRGIRSETNWVFSTKVENDRVYVRLKTDEEIEQYYKDAVPAFRSKQTIILKGYMVGVPETSARSL